ncbi:MAG: ATP-dependent zinc metalloprotease FtsH, partial [Pseudobdellovibrio sp.]
MSPLGPLAYEKNDGPVFLGMGHGSKVKDYSEAKAQEIDAEISKIINTGYATALKILTDQKDSLERITQALLEFETIDGAEVEMLIKGAAVSEIAKVRNNKKETSLELQKSYGEKESDSAPNRKPVSAT